MTTLADDTSFIDDFFDAYLECALWSSLDYFEEGAEPRPMDENYEVDDIADESRASMRAECLDFIAANSDDLGLAATMHERGDWSYAEQAGHDFWLTRNGHGAGFWDRGLGDVGDRLSHAAKVYGGCDLYVGDDGKVYAS